MTDKQREQIRKLRYEGAGYKAIATELDLSLNTVNHTAAAIYFKEQAAWRQ